MVKRSLCDEIVSAKCRGSWEDVVAGAFLIWKSHLHDVGNFCQNRPRKGLLFVLEWFEVDET